MHNTLTLLQTTDFPAITRQPLETLQVNLGYLCNLSCLHCHVNAGPKRKEMMNRKTVNQIIHFIQAEKITTLDLTGGAPEMNPHFRDLIIAARAAGCRVIDRCNLTILQVSGYQDLVTFFAENQVEIVASLPCYSEDNVDRQRGDGVFIDSIKSLKQLNDAGYGQAQTGLILNLVYNPQGISLPPAQKELELTYKQHLKEEFDIVFNQLFTITNMPIKRFGSTLISKGQFATYMQLLRDNYRPENLDSVMCRTVLSVDWQGYIYDCDFNQMLDLPTPLGRRHIRELKTKKLNDATITVLDHCYGCTAGQGSSCGGALD